LLPTAWGKFCRWCGRAKLTNSILLALRKIIGRCTINPSSQTADIPKHAARLVPAPGLAGHQFGAGLLLRGPSSEREVSMNLTDPATILAVWKKGKIAGGKNKPEEWRKDECGAWMYFKKYGDRDSQYGWEIDHIISIDNGGSDAIGNLRPLQWENNVATGTHDLVCKVTAKGVNNGPV